ncbi:MAG TPA: HNH endonuclease signature motif containing protein [Actinomycetota bacterium]|nr:HNH endonuclease signature motif containing protein [Actinomycetota bacterium]
MFDQVEECSRRLTATLADFDFSSLEEVECRRLYERLVKLERVVTAAKSLAAERLAETRGWYTHRSPAHLMADLESRPVNRTAMVLSTVEAMHKLPEVEAAYRRGSLNDEQAIEVVSAAQADPDQQTYLLAAAEYAELQQFRRECARVRSAALSEDQRQQTAHRRRHLRHWVDPDGAFRLSGRFTVVAGAEILAALEPYRQKVADRASRKGRKGKTSADAALADAMVDMCRHAAPEADNPLRPRPRTTIHVRVDHSALLRGHARSGEICEVDGAGPVPVSQVHEWMRQPDAFIYALLDEGADITRVSRVSRRIPAKVVFALRQRDPSCVVPGCGETKDLQIDHIVPIERGGPTTLYNLARLCARHHYLKTHHGYLLKRRLGHWLWEDPGGVPPDEAELQEELVACRKWAPDAQPAGT